MYWEVEIFFYFRIYVYIYVYIQIYIYIYIEREREREREKYAALCLHKLNFIFKNFSNKDFFPLRKIKFSSLFPNHYSTFFRFPKVPARKYSIFGSAFYKCALPLWPFSDFFFIFHPEKTQLQKKDSNFFNFKNDWF